MKHLRRTLKAGTFIEYGFLVGFIALFSVVSIGAVGHQLFGPDKNGDQNNAFDKAALFVSDPQAGLEKEAEDVAGGSGNNGNSGTPSPEDKISEGEFTSCGDAFSQGYLDDGVYNMGTVDSPRPRWCTMVVDQGVYHGGWQLSFYGTGHEDMDWGDFGATDDRTVADFLKTSFSYGTGNQIVWGTMYSDGSYLMTGGVTGSIDTLVHAYELGGSWQSYKTSPLGTTTNNWYLVWSSGASRILDPSAKTKWQFTPGSRSNSALWTR